MVPTWHLSKKKIWDPHVSECTLQNKKCHGTHHTPLFPLFSPSPPLSLSLVPPPLYSIHLNRRPTNRHRRTLSPPHFGILAFASPVSKPTHPPPTPACLLTAQFPQPLKLVSGTNVHSPSNLCSSCCPRKGERERRRKGRRAMMTMRRMTWASQRSAASTPKQGPHAGRRPPPVLLLAPCLLHRRQARHQRPYGTRQKG